MSRKNKALVTGGAGFIGSHVTDELIKMNCDVTVLDDLSGGFKSNVNRHAHFIRGSINNICLINRIFARRKFDYVFHLAAYAAEGLSHFIKRFNYVNNLIGSINLINASVNNGIKCFVFTSSIAVYGSQQVPMREDMVPRPEDSYGIAKYAVELELERVRDIFGMDYIIFRPHNVYGERQNIGDRYRNVIGIFMNQIMQGKAMTVFGDGKQKRAFTHIENVAPIIARSVFVPKAYNEIFNIGADHPVTINRLAYLVATTMDTKLRVKYLPARNEAKYAYAVHGKVRRIFGGEKEIPLEQGVNRMAAWAKEIGPRKSRKFYRIEINKNLPLSWRD